MLIDDGREGDAFESVMALLAMLRFDEQGNSKTWGEHGANEEYGQ